MLLHDRIALSGNSIQEVERLWVWSLDKVDEGIWALSALVEARYSQRHCVCVCVDEVGWMVVSQWRSKEACLVFASSSQKRSPPFYVHMFMGRVK